jgi:hypothetical protein
LGIIWDKRKGNFKNNLLSTDRTCIFKIAGVEVSKWYEKDILIEIAIGINGKEFLRNR